MKKRVIIIFALLALLVTTVLCACTGPKSDGNEYVTLEINPSVEMVVDANGTILEINGKNDDGKMLIVNSELKGKTVEAAVDIMVDEAIATGYLTAGNESQKVSISWTATNQRRADKQLSNLQETVNKALEKSGVVATIETLESRSLTYLREVAQAYDPSLKEADLEALTIKELLTYTQLSVLEKSKIPTVEAEEFYETMKKYEFEFKNRQAILDAADSLGSIQKGAYQVAITALKSAIDGLLKIKQDVFLDPESNYNKAITTLEEKKDLQRVVSYKLAITSSEGEVIDLEAQLSAANLAIEAAIGALEGIKSVADSSINSAIAIIDAAIAKLDQLQLMIEGIDVEQIADSVIAQINDSKNTFLNSFEEDYENFIDAHNERVVARQNKVKAQIKGE